MVRAGRVIRLLVLDRHLVLGPVPLPHQRPVTRAAGDQRRCEEHDVRHARYKADQQQNAGDRNPGAGDADLAADILGHVMLRGNAGDDDRGGDRQKKGWNLRHKAVADRQQYIGLGRDADRQVMLRQADDQAADNIDHKNQDRGDGVALDEFRGTIHGAVKVGLLGDFLTPDLGFLIRQHAGIEIGVDRHLLARHRIKGKARRHFRHPAGTAGDNDKVDDDQDQEDKQPDGVIAGNDKVSKGFNNLSCGVRPGVALA